MECKKDNFIFIVLSAFFNKLEEASSAAMADATTQRS